MAWNATHMAAPRNAMISTAMAAEIPRLAVERQYRHQPVERLDVGDRSPLAQCVDLGQTLTDASADACEITCAVATAASPDPVQRGAEAEPGREQHRQLLGDDRKLERQTPLPRLGGRREALLE